MTPTTAALSAGMTTIPPQAETHFAIALVAAIFFIIVVMLLAALRDQARRARELDAIVEANRKRLHVAGNIVVMKPRHAPPLVEGDLGAQEGEAD